MAKAPSQSGKGSVAESSATADASNLSAFQLYHLAKYAEIGMSLSGEEDVNRLLEMIIHEAREITDADAGTLYMVTEEGTHLRFVVLQNDTMNTRMGGTSGVEINLPPVPLYVDGKPNHANVSSYVALTGELVNIADVYESEDFDFTGPRKYDEATGYRSKSMLVIPMRNHENDVIGVMQLLNAQDIRNLGEIGEFSDDRVALVASLASQAAAALTKTKLIQDLKDLFYAFIKSIANAIEEKSPYTGGHINRVVDLTMMIAEAVDKAEEGPFADAHFTEDEMEELKLAAWLHDVGKIITPEFVVDKSSKLETIFDRVHMVAARFDLIAKNMEAGFLARKVALLEQGGSKAKLARLDKEMTAALKELADERAFALSCNEPGEFMSDERIERLKGVAAKTFEVNGETQTYLTDNEVENLCIRKGTLTEEERKVIENHATMTGKILGELPFPKKLSRVPEYARGHHEKMDGSGYPFGLKGDELPLQARIMAVADIFEALTAKDRPYKKPMPLSMAVRILGFMKKDYHVDPEVHDLFLCSGLFKEYADRELLEWQVDDVVSNPCLGSLRVLAAPAEGPPAEPKEDGPDVEATPAAFAMTSWGGVLTPAKDSATAQRQLRRAFTDGRPFRVAVLDAALPGKGGLSVAGALAKVPGFPMDSLVLVVPEDDADARAAALGLGVAGCVAPPADGNLLRPLIFDILTKPPHRALKPSTSEMALEPVDDTHRILLVDSSANTRMLIRYYLHDEPYEVDYADNGRKAVEMYTKSRYDLVIMAMQLPVMSGFDAVRAMREWEGKHAAPRVPVIALTAHYVSDEAPQSLEAGCDDYLTKPISKTRMVETVEKHKGRCRKA